MATVPIFDGTDKSKKVGTIDLPDACFAAPVRQHLLHAAVTWQLAKARAGTGSSKSRSQVRGSTAKLFRQKGIGRARMGAARSSLRIGGGTAHGPHPRDFGYKLPKKMRRGALISALSLRQSEDKLFVVKDFELGEIKTKKLAAALDALGVGRRALIVVEEMTEELGLSARNLPGVSVITAAGANVYDILSHPNLVFTEGGLNALIARVERPITRGPQPGEDAEA